MMGNFASMSRFLQGALLHTLYPRIALPQKTKPVASGLAMAKIFLPERTRAHNRPRSLHQIYLCHMTWERRTEGDAIVGPMPCPSSTFLLQVGTGGWAVKAGRNGTAAGDGSLVFCSWAPSIASKREKNSKTGPKRWGDVRGGESSRAVALGKVALKTILVSHFLMASLSDAAGFLSLL